MKLKNAPMSTDMDTKITWFDRVIRKPHTVLYIKAEESVPLLLLEILKELKKHKV